MSLFKYTVTNKEGKKLSGTIEAVSEILARQELNDLGFSILDFSEITNIESETKEGHEKFEFEAIDIHSKIVKGTIPAVNIVVASKRLKTEYDLTVLAIWKENSKPEEIEKAKNEGKIKLQNFLEQLSQEKTSSEQAQSNSSEQVFIKEKVDYILKKVLNLLKKFDTEFDPETKNEINKKIDKLLRIKNSNNTEYISITAKELLSYIESQAKSLEEKGYHDKRIELKLETSSLLDELKKTQAPKTLKEDLSSKLKKWQKKHQITDPNNANFFNKLINKFVVFTNKVFYINPEIQVLNDEISVLKKQRFDLFKLIFKEPTKEYRNRLITNIKTISTTIKGIKGKIKTIKKGQKSVEKKEDTSKIQITNETIEEINILSGFILFIYLAYYFIAHLLTVEEIFTTPPNGFNLFQDNIFKYMISIIFIIHALSSIKINFFPKNKIINISFPLIGILLIVLTLLNF